jgi:non-ribosomal peptide synthetase component F
MNNLGGEIHPLNLPYDFTHPTKRSFQGATVRFNFGSELLNGIEVLRRCEEVTPFMILLTGLYVLLYRYSGEEDIIVGSPASGRDLSELKHQIGLFINAIALRKKINPDQSFRELLHEVRQTTLNAYEHQEYPFDRLLIDLQVKRDMGRAPLFDVLLLVNDDLLWKADDLSMQDVQIESYELENGNSKFDLTFTFDISTEKLILNVEYSTDVFVQETIEKIGLDFRMILEQLMQDQSISISDTSLIASTDFEKSQYQNFTQTL